MTADLAVEAVKNSCVNGKNTKGIVFHSDLGSPYTSKEFEGYLSEKELLLFIYKINKKYL